MRHGSPLLARPQGLFSRAFDVSCGGRHLATLSLRWLREAGRLSLEGSTFEIGREGWLSGEFYLARGGTRLASATKSLTRRFEVRTTGARLTLRAEWPLRRSFVLEQDGRVVGSIRPTGLFVRTARIELPEELPLEVRLFLTWLVLVMWKRAASRRRRS